MESPTKSWKEEIKKVENCIQRQDSLTDQLTDLIFIANKFGFFDAADYLKNIIKNNKK